MMALRHFAGAPDPGYGLCRSSLCSGQAWLLFRPFGFLLPQKAFLFPIQILPSLGLALTPPLPGSHPCFPLVPSVTTSSLPLYLSISTPLSSALHRYVSCPASPLPIPCGQELCFQSFPSPSTWGQVQLSSVFLCYIVILLLKGLIAATRLFCS